jgi:hypothetical protein
MATVSGWPARVVVWTSANKVDGMGEAVATAFDGGVDDVCVLGAAEPPQAVRVMAIIASKAPLMQV